MRHRLNVFALLVLAGCLGVILATAASSSTGGSVAVEGVEAAGEHEGATRR